MAKIFFDFDGVLICSRRMDRTFLWSERLEQELGISNEVQKQIFHPAGWRPVIAGKMQIADHLKAIFESNGLSNQVEAYIRYWLERDMHWRLDVVELAKDLASQGHDLFVATNQDKVRGQHIKNHAIITQTFSKVFTSADLGIAKPDSVFFSTIQALLGPRKTDRLILVDDDLENVKSAKSTGWHGIHYDPDLNHRFVIEELRHRVLDSLI